MSENHIGIILLKIGLRIRSLHAEEFVDILL